MHSNFDVMLKGDRDEGVISKVGIRRAGTRITGLEASLSLPRQRCGANTSRNHWKYWNASARGNAYFQKLHRAHRALHKRLHNAQKAMNLIVQTDLPAVLQEYTEAERG